MFGTTIIRAFQNLATLDENTFYVLPIIVDENTYIS